MHPQFTERGKLILNINNYQKEKTMPTETSEVYECEICGAIVEVKEGGAGTLECCGQPMALQE
jgi:desulfoferrodoxin FeS4 iron-binding domain